MTSSPSDTEATPHPLQEFAESVAAVVAGTAEIGADMVKVRVSPEDWLETHQLARDHLGLVFFSWLSAIDWANEVAAGDSLTDEVEERIELLTVLSDLTDGKRITFSTDLPHDKPSIPSLVDVYAGANWHEREAAEMFGIEFKGHPGLEHLYLPEGFLGNPLRKSFPLLSREVKPWPGSVDVEGLPDEPSTENPES